MRPRDSKTPPNAAAPAGSANAPNARRERRRPFNREYQRRAARFALSRVACTLIEDPESGFYRTGRLASAMLADAAKRKKPAETTEKSPQLTLDFVQDPLYDLWHEPEEIT